MSYSLTIRAATAAAALAAAMQRFDSEVVAKQPPHAADRDLVHETAGKVLATLTAEPGEGQEIALNITGGLGGNLDWQGNSPEAQVIQSCTINVNAYIANKKA